MSISRALVSLASWTLLCLALTSSANAQKPAALVVIEQDGKQIQPSGGEIRVPRMPFTLVMTIPKGTEVLAHASTSPAAHEAARAGRPLEPFFVDGGAVAVDMLNSAKTLFLATEDRPMHQAWFYQAPDDHTFDSVSVQGATQVARFTVAVLALPDPAQYRLDRFPGREVFITFRVIGAANRAEVRRDAIKITLADASLTSAAAAQVEKEEPPIRLPPGAPEPKKLKHVDAEYPDRARSARIQGVVQIEAVIGADGTVRDAKVVRSIPLLDGAALDAVRQWQFEPVLIDGNPRAVLMTVSVNFSLR